MQVVWEAVLPNINRVVSNSSMGQMAYDGASLKDIVEMRVTTSLMAQTVANGFDELKAGSDTTKPLINYLLRTYSRNNNAKGAHGCTNYVS